MMKIRLTIIRARGRMALMGVGALLLALSPLQAAAINTAPLTPTATLPVGTVVLNAPMTLPADLAAVATAKRMYYVTTDIHNTKMLSSGMVITPKTPTAHPDVVAWAHGTTGIGKLCGPSTNQNVFWEEAVVAIKSYIDHGWVVAATDYPGLGTPTAHQYLIGDSEARAVIDSVRAARMLDTSLTSNYVVSGHSQGGQAALFAGEIADTYGTGLDLKGVVAMAPPSQPDLVAPEILGTPANGYAIAALAGLAAVDSSVNMYDILATPAKLRLPLAYGGCYDLLLGSYQNLTAEQMVPNGDLPQGIVDKLMQYGQPAQQANTVPVMLVQGTDDESVPIDLTYILQAQICAYNTPTQLHIVPGADHEEGPIQSTGVVADYITGRFAGATPPSNCQ